MKHLFTIFCISIFALNCNAQDTLKISDLNILDDTSWKGKLTYKDYQSGEQESIDATMQVKIEKQKIIYSIQYTYEPNRNYNSSVKIKKNGTYYGNEKVLSNILENGIRTVVTTYEGKDNGKKATMFITHRFNKTHYTEIKEVLFKDSDERFMRNTYEFERL